MTDQERAKATIKKAKGQPIFMVVFPRKTDNDYPKDEGMSAPVATHCRKCKQPVWSTNVKEIMKQLEPNQVNLLCTDCMTSFILGAKQAGLTPAYYQMPKGDQEG